MKHPILLLLPLSLAAANLHAQAAQQKPAATAVGTLGSLWQQITGYITTAAEELPESKYAYRPTPDVRTFGQLIGHIAGAQQLICSAALGEPGGAEDEIERTRTSKADLVTALKASTQHCARAYAQTDAAALQSTRLFGQERDHGCTPWD